MSPLERWKAVVEMQGLSKSEKAVLNSLAFHAINPVVWVSITTLAQQTAYERTAVRRALSSLVKKGVISLARQSTGSGPNHYRLHLEKGERSAPGAENTGCEIPQKGVRKAAKGGAPRSPNKEGTGKEQNTPSATPSIWDLWIDIAGENHRSTLGRLFRDHDDIEVAKAVAIVAQKKPADPVSYIHGILKPQVRKTAI